VLQLAVRVLPAATETYIRVNDQGMLSIHHKIESEDSLACFVSFILMPDEHDSDTEA
jgi:hypothetical protein